MYKFDKTGCQEWQHFTIAPLVEPASVNKTKNWYIGFTSPDTSRLKECWKTISKYYVVRNTFLQTMNQKINLYIHILSFYRYLYILFLTIILLVIDL